MYSQSLNDALHCPENLRVKRVEESFLDFPLHFHDSCELIFIEEGFGTRLVGDHTGTFMEGDMVLLGPNLPHCWQTNIAYQRGRNLRVIADVIYFKPDFLTELTGGLPDDTPVSEFLSHSLRGISFYGSTQRLVRRKIRKMMAVEGLKKIIRALDIIESLIDSEEYTLLASARYAYTLPQKDTRRFNTIYRYITAHFNKEISLNEVAAVATLSPKAFCRYFKKHTGIPFVRFINSLRIEHACRMLQNTEYTISEVCFESGYNNLTHFINCFKQLMEKTPGEYRKLFLKRDRSQEGLRVPSWSGPEEPWRNGWSGKPG